jgi:peroxiredoxin
MRLARQAVVLAAATAVLTAPPPARAAAVVGTAAPEFSATDTTGSVRTLAAYKGKFVVLEWVNFDCPFVGKHYGSGHMQKLQRDYTAKGVVWLSVNSSAPGREGSYPADKLQALMKQRSGAPTALLVDGTGAVARAYAAKTTPHMFIIDPAGKLIYAGGIDDTPSTDQADIATARNYVSSALDEALAGKPVTTSASAPYGCSVKY